MPLALASTGSTTLSQSGNEITGEYSLTETGHQATTLDQSGTVGPRTLTVHEIAASDTTRTESGNSITGNSTFDATGDSSGLLVKDDLYDDGGEITEDADSSHQSVVTTGTSQSSGTGNAITGLFTQAATGSETVTTDESGVRAGQAYTLHATHTSATVASQTTGNSLTGEEAFASSTTETGSSTLTVVSPAGSLSVVQTSSIDETSTRTSNALTGAYAEDDTVADSRTLHQETDSDDQSSTVDQSETLAFARSEAGNTITGLFNRTVVESDDTVLVVTYSAATLRVAHLDAARQSTITESGNSVTGDYLLTDTSAATRSAIRTARGLVARRSGRSHAAGRDCPGRSHRAVRP